MTPNESEIEGLCPENMGCNCASVCLCAIIEDLQEKLTTAEARGRERGLEEAAKDCDEWAEANRRLGNLRDIYCYTNAAQSIRRLTQKEEA